MAASLQTRTKEETKIPRKETIVSSGGGGGGATATAAAAFISMPQPKIRIKLPKFLAKALQRGRNYKFNDAESADNGKSKKRWGGKVGSIVSNLFGGGKKCTEPEASSDAPREIAEEREAKRSENDDDRTRRSGLGFDINVFRAGSSESANVPNRKIRKGRSVRTKGIADRAGVGVGERGGEVELCKKRILMGEKCRPLNLSGKLHYDKNGVFLAEEVHTLKEV